MSRSSRTLLVMGLMALGGVAVLSWMAQRYGEVLSRRDGASGRAAVPGEELPERDAERLVDAYVRVGRTLAAAPDDTGPEGQPGPPAGLRGVLADHGLTAEQYQELEALVAAWRAGSAEVPPAYREALDRRRGELERIPAE